MILSAGMAKYKAVKFKASRGKTKAATPPPGGVACIVVVVGIIALVMLFMYLVLKSNANG
jgi:hypothetical protein